MATAAKRPTPPSPAAGPGDVSEVELSEAGSPDLGSGSSGSGGSGRSAAEYSGWVYHLGVNSIGHEYCHLRFLVIRGRTVAMYKRDPHDHPGLVGSSSLAPHPLSPSLPLAPLAVLGSEFLKAATAMAALQLGLGPETASSPDSSLSCCLQHLLVEFVYGAIVQFGLKLLREFR
jgi:hypothetical protein